MPSVPSTTKTGLIFFFVYAPASIIPAWRKNHFGVTYNKLVASKAGDFIEHMSHMVYFSKTNENRRSENDPLLFILSLVGHGPNPLSMISISNMRHSQASCCISPVKK